MDSDTEKQLDLIAGTLPEFAFDVVDTFRRAVASELLTATQTWGVILASAYTTRNNRLIKVMENAASAHINATTINAARMAASVMSMNNVYWRFWHYVDDKDYLQIKSDLAQESFHSHGIEDIDFEMMCLAVSDINICSGCLRTHSRGLLREGVAKEQVMHIVRLAATVHGMATSLAAGG